MKHSRSPNHDAPKTPLFIAHLRSQPSTHAPETSENKDITKEIDSVMEQIIIHVKDTIATYYSCNPSSGDSAAEAYHMSAAEAPHRLAL